MATELNTRVKLCGLTKIADVEAATLASAAYIGLVFFKKSPRNVNLATARSLALATEPGVAKVGLVVNPDNQMLDGILNEVPLDMIQLHGKETPDRVAEVKVRTGLPVMKAVGIATATDINFARAYVGVADQLLLDAKPVPGELPGGNGLSFDWRLLQGVKWGMPWMLAGGLNPENVAEAVRLTGAQQVDVSSGIEGAPGVKDPAKIAAFAKAAQTNS